jgi:hypothetical protein
VGAWCWLYGYASQIKHNGSRNKSIYAVLAQMQRANNETPKLRLFMQATKSRRAMAARKKQKKPQTLFSAALMLCSCGDTYGGVEFSMTV